MEEIKVNDKTYTVKTEKYTDVYISSQAFNVLVQLRGYDVDEYRDDCIDVRGAYTIDSLLKENRKILTEKDKVELDNSKKMLEQNIVQYITFVEEI